MSVTVITIVIINIVTMIITLTIHIVSIITIACYLQRVRKISIAAAGAQVETGGFGI